MVKKILQYFLSASLLIALGLAIFEYYIIDKPNSTKLKWVSNLYDSCIETSSQLSPTDIYTDLNKVTVSQHSPERLRKYLEIMQQYSQQGSCALESSEQCLDTYLYVSRSFLIRGNEQDIKSATSSLKLYRQYTDANLYYDTVSLGITIFNGKKITAKRDYYQPLLDQVMTNANNDNYFSRPHNQQTCRIILDHIGATYSLMEEFDSDLYITTYLL